MLVYEPEADLNQLDSLKSTVLTCQKRQFNDILSAVVKHAYPDSETRESLSAPISRHVKLP